MTATHHTGFSWPGTLDLKVVPSVGDTLVIHLKTDLEAVVTAVTPGKTTVLELVLLTDYPTADWKAGDVKKFKM